MQTEKWDQELWQIAANLTKLEEQFFDQAKAGVYALHKKQKSVLDHQRSLHSILVSLKEIAATKSSLSPRHAAIVKHGTKIAARALELFESRSELTGRIMWVNLIRYRFTGSRECRDQPVSDTELLEIATRELHLKNSEKYLQKRLVELDAQKKSITRVYEETITRLSNANAAGSMHGEFGKNPADSLTHPANRGLKSYLNHLTGSSRSTTKEEKRLRGKEKTALKESGVVMRELKKVLRKDIGPDRYTITDNTLKKMEKAISDLESLQKEVEVLRAEVSRRAPEPARPILVKKKAGQDRKKTPADKPPRLKGNS